MSAKNLSNQQMFWESLDDPFDVAYRDVMLLMKNRGGPHVLERPAGEGSQRHDGRSGLLSRSPGRLHDGKNGCCGKLSGEGTVSSGHFYGTCCS